MSNTKIEVYVPDYDPSIGLKFEWDDDPVISTSFQKNEIIISANKDGLVSLARHLLMLAQDKVPKGHHIHLDEFSGLEDKSVPLIIEKH
ncbi:MAG: hypothetical protein JNK42_01645 [Caedimonas sp.]|nr:hypothetical protein [Caedimonas sp.]